MPSTILARSPATARRLMEAMTGSSALPAFVRQIDPRTLTALVEEVGIEDSGALIAHVSNTQLVHLLDETIWTGARPGDPEKLSVAELLRWLDLWNGLGPSFAADKLYELGHEFCTLVFSRLLIVSDHDLAPRVLDEHTQAVGTFLVRIRVDDEWDTVQTAVNALWGDYPDFAEGVLGALSFRHSTLRMFGEDDSARVLDADASYAHEQSREEAGYVTSIMAGSYLRELARADVDVLALESAYDLHTQEYFRRRRQLQRASAASVERPERATDGAGGGDAGGDDEEESPPAPARQAEIDLLAAELAAYERARHQPRALLTGPETEVVKPSDWIRTALGRLQSEPGIFDTRLDEITYLANLLMAGGEAGGERLDSGAAANLAVSTCNLGAHHELWLAGDDDPVGAVVEMLRAEPGLVRLFRIGWHLTANLASEAAARVVAVFADEAVRERLAAKPWVLTEVDALLGSPDFETTVAARQFEDARETLKILGIALEAEAVVALCLLIDAVPRFARVLEDRPPEGAVATYARRDIATMGDLMTVHRFLDQLAGQVRL